jgi:hypothetical protein
VGALPSVTVLGKEDMETLATHDFIPINLDAR